MHHFGRGSSLKPLSGLYNLVRLSLLYIGIYYAIVDINIEEIDYDIPVQKEVKVRIEN
jgi:hypothetical protein